ncbi:Protein of unknown function DUF3511 [Dillenia turbinata]|uniref:Uncharacterized protein n=1 Tax=Dillenia turbinata TaxID=194707 RepID=A0AAN8UKG6_9MAGN
MEDFRSKSYAGGERWEMESYYGYGGNRPTSSNNPRDLRCYSATYSYASSQPPQQQVSKEFKLKKAKTTSGSSSKNWVFSDPEFQRKKRVASYKVYDVEGKMKGSFRKSFRKDEEAFEKEAQMD